MERTKPAIGEIYHVYNRGVDKRNVFLDQIDYIRFVHILYEFNNNLNANRWHASSMSGVGLLISKKPIVDLLAFCLMPNHYHLMIQEQQENGISEFMHKLGTGYTNYFNKKYERTGALFQGKYKIVHIIDDKHLQYLPYYIHLNPLDLILPNWRDGVLDDTKKALRFLHSYRWSSYLDYTGTKNFPSITKRDFLTEVMGNSDEQQKQMLDWVCRNGVEEIEHICLE